MCFANYKIHIFRQSVNDIYTCLTFLYSKVRRLLLCQSPSYSHVVPQSPHLRLGLERLKQFGDLGRVHANSKSALQHNPRLLRIKVGRRNAPLGVLGANETVHCAS